ncbi:hypothetical protein DUI87_23334 [Hirundo rustica rustica]|uniref:Uncharacterized protein n=1 Tax=Hirundo rustica rustica TaxID=333673 RepID=A0A3M0JYA6_HIRRU|nr:hypothetical protein DUI87_23334 [Hirundo rustica rustica]
MMLYCSTGCYGRAQLLHSPSIVQLSSLSLGTPEKMIRALGMLLSSVVRRVVWINEHLGKETRSKPVREGDLDSQPTSITEPLEDAEAKPVREGDLDSQPTSKTEPLEDAEVLHQKSVQKEELTGGRSGSVAASAAERKEMPDTVTVTDADKARAAKPVREGDLDYQPTFRMEPLEGAEGPPRGKNKATGHKESHEAKNSMKEIVEEWHKGHDWEHKLHNLDALLDDSLKLLEDAEGKFSVCLS